MHTLLLQAQDSVSIIPKGLYFGQQPVMGQGVIFAKDIISTPGYEHSAPAFSPDRKTVLWTVLEMNKPAKLLEMTMENNEWSHPHLPSFADSLHDDFYPFFLPDGKTVVFSSRRLLPTGLPSNDMSLWVVDLKENGWGKPRPFDGVVSKGFEYAHSLTKEGNLYFSSRQVVNGKPSWKIFVAKHVNGKYEAPQPLDSAINDGSYVDGPCIAPDESFLIFESDRAGGMGSTDLYICFKKNDGKWELPINMGPKINSNAAERFAGLSPDGKYFFFGSNRSSNLPDVYWINASVIDELRNSD